LLRISTNSNKKILKKIEYSLKKYLNNEYFFTLGETQNGILYQYYPDFDEWRQHPSVTMRVPRSSAAVFQVPKHIFKNC
jgi:hypothetical protein